MAAQVLIEQAGARLAARTVVGRKVRADEYRFEADSLRSEQLEQELLRLAEGGLRETRRTETVLIAHHDEYVACIPQGDERRDEVGRQPQLAEAVGLLVGRLGGQRSVPLDTPPALACAGPRCRLPRLA